MTPYSDEDVGEYGPHGGELMQVFTWLDEIPWMERVGSAWPGQAGVETVNDWDAALAPLMTASLDAYGPNGHLFEPSQRCIGVIESETWRDYWERAREDVAPFTNFSPYIPRALSKEQCDEVWEYLYEFVSFLLAECIAPEVVDMHYFRDMLTWFRKGHFPCGWEGVWPQGRMRVY